MTRNIVPALLIWCDAWAMNGWKAFTGSAEPPKADSPAFQAWRSTLRNLSTLEAVAASLEHSKSNSQIPGFSRTITKRLNKCGLGSVISQFMIDRKIDAESIAVQTNSRLPPRTYRRWIDPHISALGLALFGMDAKQSGLSNVVNDRVYAVTSHLMKMAFEQQSKRLMFTEATLQSAIENLQERIECGFCQFSSLSA